MSSFTSTVSPLTNLEICVLIEKSNSGDLEAREKVLLSCLPLAEKFAKRYDSYGVPYEDLYQEACYGIIMAMTCYNPQKNASFKTYCSYHIRKYIFDALKKQNSNFPSGYDRDFYREITGYTAAIKSFEEANGRLPNDTEMSEQLNISLLRLQRIKRAADSFMSPSIDIDQITNTYNPHAGMRFLEDEVVDKIVYQEIKCKLKPRELEVLERRCGFTTSGVPEKWEYISANMGISIETARKSFNKAIHKLRIALDVETK